MFKEKKCLLRRIHGIQSVHDYSDNPFLHRLEIELKQKLEEIVDCEEAIWLQKSRNEWIADGDRNTRLYHAKTITQRGKNKILALRGDAEDWIYGQNILKSMAHSFYSNLFNEEDADRSVLNTIHSSPALLERNVKSLDYIFSDQEIHNVIFQMGPLKVPREDLFPSLFFQRQWAKVGPKLCEFDKYICQNNSLIQEVNKTLLVLIAKVNKPEFIPQFRPISLCNLSYKCFTKAIVNHIKPHLADCISSFQVRFVPGRNIHDNVIVSHELVDTMSKMRCRHGFMSIMIDLEKAYDRLS